MRILALLILAVALSGCASPLRKALESGDIAGIEAHLPKHTFATSDDFKAEKEAIQVLSNRYADEFLKRPDHEIHLDLFDQHCRSRMPTRFPRVCSEESRQRVLAAEDAIAQKRAVARQQEIERIRAELASGKRQINSLMEAELALQPADGDQLLFSPHVSGGDGKYYRISTYITAKLGENYLSWWPDAGIHHRAGAIILKPKAMYGDIRFGSPVGVVGKYVGNQTIPLANGGQATVPVFGEAYVEGGR